MKKKLVLKVLEINNKYQKSVYRERHRNEHDQG